MRMVAPIWRAVALAMPLAAAAGCDWIPVRRRLDPSLYPVPVRADATYLRRSPNDPSPGSGPAAAAAADPAVEADADADDRSSSRSRMTDRRELPPLPDLTRVPPEEVLFPPAPTPLLDAALVRAMAVRGAVLDEPEGDGQTSDDILDADGSTTEPKSTGEGPTATDQDRSGNENDPPEEIEPGTIDLPPMVPEEGGAAARPVESQSEPQPVDLPPLESIEQEPEPDPVSTLEPVGRPPEDEPEIVLAASAGIEPDDHWRVGLENLLTIAGEEATRGGESAEVWAARRRVLDWIAEAEGTVDDATLWETVMVMLAEPDAVPLEAGPSIVELSEDPSTALRVSRVAFCREVVGFGQIDPIDAGACRSSQDVILYCELEGVSYRADADSHAARLSTTLEILPEADAPALWREVRPVEDRCTRPRRDFFVGYGITLPDSLSPGRYRFRVTQDDLVSGSEAVGELPFEIRAPAE